MMEVLEPHSSPVAFFSSIWDEIEPDFADLGISSVAVSSLLRETERRNVASKAELKGDELARLSEIQHKAFYDALTNLPNRYACQEHLGQICHASRSFSVMFMDLDGFKLVNDTYGHRVGDELLQLVAARIRSALRNHDFIGRLAGDEFLIVPEDRLAKADIEHLSQRIIKEINRPYQIASHLIRVGASIGVSFVHSDGKQPKELLEKADQALYAAKASGKNTCVFFSDMPTRLTPKQRLPDLIELALNGHSDALKVEYLPTENFAMTQLSLRQADEPVEFASWWSSLPPSTGLGLAKWWLQSLQHHVCSQPVVLPINAAMLPLFEQGIDWLIHSELDIALLLMELPTDPNHIAALQAYQAQGGEIILQGSEQALNLFELSRWSNLTIWLSEDKLQAYPQLIQGLQCFGHQVAAQDLPALMQADMQVINHS